MRVLIVEDETRLAETLRQLMRELRYQADVVHTGKDGLDYGLAGQYDLILLDVMLPELDGFQVARQLRAARVSTPILMLTARDGVADKISGLDCGADDYMTKPFDTGELLARVRALTRRQGEILSDVLTAGDLSLDCSAHALTCGDRSVRLGYKEYEVLACSWSTRAASLPRTPSSPRCGGWSRRPRTTMWRYISLSCAKSSAT